VVVVVVLDVDVDVGSASVAKTPRLPFAPMQPGPSAALHSATLETDDALAATTARSQPHTRPASFPCCAQSRACTSHIPPPIALVLCCAWKSWARPGPAIIAAAMMMMTAATTTTTATEKGHTSRMRKRGVKTVLAVFGGVWPCSEAASHSWREQRTFCSTRFGAGYVCTSRRNIHARLRAHTSHCSSRDSSLTAP
jgi:hypothetical protein